MMQRQQQNNRSRNLNN